MDTTWVKLGSWHALSEDDEEGGWKTLCGLKVSEGAETSAKLHRNEDLCQNCLEEIGVITDVEPILPSEEPIE